MTVCEHGCNCGYCLLGSYGVGKSVNQKLAFGIVEFTQVGSNSPRHVDEISVGFIGTEGSISI